MDLFGRVEVDAIDQVHHVAQKVTAFHSVGETLKNGRNHVAPLASAIVTAQAAQIGEQAGATAAVRSFSFVRDQERQEVRACDAVGVRRPVAPAIRRLDD